MTAPDKLLIIAKNSTTNSVWPALLLASGARHHDIATDIMFSDGALEAVVAASMDEPVADLLQEFTDAGGFVYVEQAALEAAHQNQVDLWSGVKAVLPPEQFRHHATEHTQIVTL